MSRSAGTSVTEVADGSGDRESEERMARLLLLASAYSPLPIILGLRDHNSRQSWWLIGAGVALALGLPLVVLLAVRLGQPSTAQATSVTSAAEEVSGYLVSMILPFATLSAPTARDLAAFGLFGAFLAAAYLQCTPTC